MRPDDFFAAVEAKQETTGFLRTHAAHHVTTPTPEQLAEMVKRPATGRGRDYDGIRARNADEVGTFQTSYKQRHARRQ